MTVLDQQLVVHLYAPADGPGAAAAYRDLRQVWLGCRLLGMRDPVPGLGLPHMLPETLTDLPAGPSAGLPAGTSAGPPAGVLVGAEAPLAAAEARGADRQVILRRHHDVLNLSVALAGPSSAVDGPGWAELEDDWNALVSPCSRHLIGETRLYLARLEQAPPGEGPPDLAAPDLAAPDLAAPDLALAGLLPAAAQAGDWWNHGVVVPRDLAFWETTTTPDDRALRRFVLAFTADREDEASAWAWSRGDPAMPPLGRYLLHAAKLRYELRVWERDGRTRELRGTLRDLSAEPHERRPATSPGADLLNAHRLDAELMTVDLLELRRAVEIAADNMGRVPFPCGPPPPGDAGPFADDRDLAAWFLDRLDDEIAYLGLAARRAEHAAAARPPAAPAPAARPDPEPTESSGPDGDIGRHVFVVHGRDEQVRTAVFDFLRALDLRPLEWEQLVEQTGSSLPFLGEVVARAVTRAQAAVVVMTPEDEVRLHPELLAPDDDPAEETVAMQVRPNVLIELGMALATYPDRTIILMVGDHRPIADLGGRNYVRLTDRPESLRKIALRLRLAGCRLDDQGQDWLDGRRFAFLRAYDRRPGTERA
ncbi:CATRA conflict system CASPASE/TPR repeat-associated protein [Nonomuraea wenchangensis]|uniref:CATRA conflict system CASPASE/TPR repeat-associated protein n=1 Tax=Nonomuraea wenchangensis TaxID=568860 RepID=UPI0037172721